MPWIIRPPPLWIAFLGKFGWFLWGPHVLIVTNRQILFGNDSATRSASDFRSDFGHDVPIENKYLEGVFLVKSSCRVPVAPIAGSTSRELEKAVLVLGATDGAIALPAPNAPGTAPDADTPAGAAAPNPNVAVDGSALAAPPLSAVPARPLVAPMPQADPATSKFFYTLKAA